MSPVPVNSENRLNPSHEFKNQGIEQHNETTNHYSILHKINSKIFFLMFWPSVKCDHVTTHL